jgi:hypothetical protein
MVNVNIMCTPNDPVEEVSLYHFFQDDIEIGAIANPTFMAIDVVPGVHKYEVAAENVWGLGPKSDPVFTPPVASKCGGVTINIVINM